MVFRNELFTASAPTIQKTRILVQKQQLCRLDHEAPPREYVFHDEPAMEQLLKSIPDYDVIIFADYAKGFLSDTLIEKITSTARTAGRFVALDPKPKHSLKYRELDLITPNRTESLQLAGIEIGRHDEFPAEDVCAAIWDKFRPKYLVVTMGQEGMLLSTEGKVIQTISTVAREVFDVSGAGDTVIAALSLALAGGVSLADAAHFANAAAGVVIGKIGTATASPAEILKHAGQ